MVWVEHDHLPSTLASLWAACYSRLLASSSYAWLLVCRIHVFVLLSAAEGYESSVKAFWCVGWPFAVTDCFLHLASVCCVSLAMPWRDQCGFVLISPSFCGCFDTWLCLSISVWVSRALVGCWVSHSDRNVWYCAAVNCGPLSLIRVDGIPHIPKCAFSTLITAVEQKSGELLEKASVCVEVFFMWRHTFTCMHRNAAYQAFWGSSFRSCVFRLRTTMWCLYFLSTKLLVAWCVCGCQEKAWFSNTFTMKYLVSITIKSVGLNTCRRNSSQYSVFIADRGFNISYSGLRWYPCLLITG